MADANINIGVNVQSKSLAQLEAQLASLNAQIKQVPIGSAKFKQLTAEFQSVSKSIEGANLRLKGFNPEETFGKIAKVAGGVGAAFAVVNLALSDNKEASEEAKKAQEALVAILGLGQAAEAVLAATQLFRTKTLLAETSALTENTVEEEINTAANYANAASLDAVTKAEIRAEIFRKNAGLSRKEYGELIRKGYEDAAQKASGAGQAVEGFGKRFTAFFKNAAKSIQAFVTSTAGAITIIAGIILYINKLNTDAAKASAQIAQYGIEIEDLGETLKKVGDGAEDTLKALTNYNALIDAGVLSAKERTKYEEGLRKKLIEQGVTQGEVNKILADGKANIDEYINSLERQAKAIAIFDLLVKKYKELFELQADQSKSAPSFLQTLGNTYKSLGDIGSFALSQIQTQQDNLNESTKGVKSEIEKLKGLIEAPIKAGDQNAIGGAKKQLDDFIGSGKTAATDISSFLRKTRDEIVKAEKDGYAEQKQLLLNAQADRAEDLKKENQKIQEDVNATAADKLKAQKNYDRLLKLQKKIDNQELEDLEREHNQKLLAIDKSSEDSREKVEADGFQRRLQLSKNANSQLTDTEEAKLKQDAKILEDTIQIELEKLQALEESYKKQKAIAEAELKLAKPEDKKAIEDRIKEADAAYKTAVAAGEGTVIDLQNQLQNLLTNIVVAGINKRAAAEQAGVTSKIVNDKKRAQKEKQDRVAAIDEEIKLYKEGSDKYVALTNEKNNLVRDLDKTAQEELLSNIKMFYDALFAAGNVYLEFLKGQQQLVSAQFDLEAARVEAGYKEKFAFIDEETQKLDEQAEKKVKYATREERQRAQLAKQRSELEKQQAAELEAIRQEQVRSNAEAAISQAELNFALIVGQAVADAALAITRQFADYPLPIAIPSAAFIAASTGVQIAQANQAKNLAIVQAQTQLASLGGGGGNKATRLSRAAGGIVDGPGTFTSDSIPTDLSRGEYVVNANATQKYLPLLNAINQQGLVAGNPVNQGLSASADMNALLTKIEERLAEPPRAYVLSTDIETVKNKENYISRRANVLI